MSELFEDHTELMKSNPENYGFVPEQLSALTPEEMMRGVTSDYMVACGEWLLARAIKRQRQIPLQSLDTAA